MGQHSFWAHLPEHINPVALSVGPVEIRWYGIMYVLAFLVVYNLVLYRIRTEKLCYCKDTIIDFFTAGIIGVLLGGRLGYVLFYNFGYYVKNPLEIFLPFRFSGGLQYTGIYGMSYHGGLIGVILAFIIFCRRRKMAVWPFIDLFAPAVALGYTFGRIGNFINGELYGRVTTLSWGMYFPYDPLRLPRHPSQLYEAFFEGIFLFAVLWSLRKKRYGDGFLATLYLFGYGFVRFFIEFTRQPDEQIGFIFGMLTMGQLLCILMMVTAVVVMVKKKLV